MTTTVTLYLSTLKQAALEIPVTSDAELEESERIFDEYSEAYIDYVRGALAVEGFDLEEGSEHGGRSYTVEGDNAEEEARAHQMMSEGEVMDFWTWYN